MGSNPIIGTLENALLPGKSLKFGDLIGCERSRTNTHEITIYLPTIRQVIYAGSRFLDQSSIPCGTRFHQPGGGNGSSSDHARHRSAFEKAMALGVRACVPTRSESVRPRDGAQ